MDTEKDAVYDDIAVPLSERKGPVTMGLLWVTMVTAFPTVLMGFEWYKAGLTLWQALIAALFSNLILALYAIAASQLGARSGLSYTVLSRGIFGRWGSTLITLNLIVIFIGFYGLLALLFADELKALFHWPIPVALLASVLAVVMALNNFFGFKGIANFARFIAAPMLIVWVFYSFCKAVIGCPAMVWSEPDHKSFAYALTTASGFIIGYGVWGNEPDYWRFSLPKTAYSAIPIVVSLLIGQFLFPITGWMVAKITGITDYSVATSFMNQYSFAGIAGLSVLVLGASYFATNDSNLFGLIEAGENLFRLRHRTWVCIWAILGSAMAAFLSLTGAAKSMESIASLNCVLLPIPTVIMLAEWFLTSRVFNSSPISSWQALSFKEIPKLRYPAIIAMLVAFAVGITTSGVIPGSEFLHIGISSLQAWLTALILYIPLRVVEYKHTVLVQTTSGPEQKQYSNGSKSGASQPNLASLDETSSKL